MLLEKITRNQTRTSSLYSLPKLTISLLFCFVLFFSRKLKRREREVRFKTDEVFNLMSHTNYGNRYAILVDLHKLK